jgi:membrane-associated protein
MNVDSIIQSGGLLAIMAMIFAESGMMLGFFFPGDTLLLAVGVLAEQGKLPVPLGLTIALIALAAILGDNTGYQIGQLGGKRLFHKKDGILFRREYVERAEKVYEKHGGKIMLLAHFLPIIRTFVPVVAGVGHMPRWKYFIYDAIGDTSWAAIVTLIGYYFGSKIPNIDSYILPTVVVVVILSFGPVLWHLLGDQKSRNMLLDVIRRKHNNNQEES